MNKGRYVIGVNREYNYHPVFHGEIFSILEEQFTLHELPVINFSELLIRAPRGSFFSKQVLSCGKFEGEADLLFSPHILLTNGLKWVMDLEHPFWLFTDHYANVEPDSFSFKLRSMIAKKWIGHQNCISVIAWSDASRDALIDFLGEKLAEKVSVIYPMVSPLPHIIRRPKDWTTLLFIMPNKDFEGKRKGKDVVLNIFRSVRNSKVNLIFVGYLSELEKAEFGGQVEHYPQVDRKTLMTEIYPRSDILLFPSRADTFGAVIIEAQSAGVIPVATYGRSVFSTPELIKDGKNGFLIKNREFGCGNSLDLAEVNVQRFGQIVRLLIDNDELRRKISCQSREIFIKSKYNQQNQRDDVLRLFLNFLQIKK